MPKTPKTKGKGLAKKAGPFPTYIWAILGGIILVIIYVYYRRHSGSANQIAGSLNQQTIPSGVIIPPTQGATDPGNTLTNGNPIDWSGLLSGLTPIDTEPDTVNYPTDYATTTDLQNGLNGLGNQVGAQIAAITFPSPTINITPAPSAVQKATSTSKTAAKKALPPGPVKYYTYKKNVPLRAGQTLHFAAKKGYYAA